MKKTPKRKFAAIPRPPPEKRAVCDLSRQEAVDELGRLQEHLLILKNTEKRSTELKAVIIGWADAEAAGERAVSYSGRVWSAEVSAKPSKQYIRSLLKLFGIWGRDKFLRLATVTLKAVYDDQQLSDAQKAHLIGEDLNVGNRTVHCVTRGVVMAGKAA